MARDLNRFRPLDSNPRVLRAVKAGDPPSHGEVLSDPFGVRDHIQWGPLDLASLDPEGVDHIKCENPY
jgi:hypothetical protein